MAEQTKSPEQPEATTAVAEIMNTNVVTLRPSDTTTSAARLMADKNISSIVITEEEKPIGIVTESDLVKKIIATESADRQATLEEVMTSPVITVTEDTSLLEASRIMEEKTIKRLVVTKDDYPVGIVTQTDILKVVRVIFEHQVDDAKHQLRQAHQKLEKITDQASHAVREAVLSDLTKNQFLATMSHEIRTPLNAIIGLSEVLAEENLTEEQRNHISIIRESARNMLVLINDIVDFSKIEAGKFDIEIEDCSLEHLLAVIESLMRPQAMQKNLDFGIFQRSDLPAIIRTDHLRLRQCLTNLINNAIDFTDKGHVYVNVQLEQIEGKPYIRFDVEDTGVGIPPDQQDKIFEQFAQLDSFRSRRRRGSGLGLAITKKLAKLLGGDVTLKSTVGVGSTFSLIIPAGVDVKSQPSFNKYDQLNRLKQDRDALPQKRLSGKVLVAEDTPTNQTLIKLLLEKMGLEVTIVQDGIEAVKTALEEDFDLILMDIQMPHMNGYDATKQLRKKGYSKPIVAVTAHAMKGDREKCLEAGCDDYLPKPIERKELIRVLEEYLKSNSKISENIDTLTEHTKETAQLCSEPGEKTNEGETLPADDLIDWEAVMEICDDESVIKQVVEMFLKDSPRCLKSLAEAINAADPKLTRMYAHSLKGASIQIGAKRLSEIAYKLECAGRDKDMEQIPILFGQLQDEYSKLRLFLSQPNWLELVKKMQGSASK